MVMCFGHFVIAKYARNKKSIQAKIFSQLISKVTLYFKFSATWPSSRNNFVLRLIESLNYFETHY